MGDGVAGFGDVPVVILCGGQGTRMQSGTPVKKELVELGGRPILWHVMKIYAAYGYNRFILALGYQAEAIKRYFLEYEPMSRDFTVRLGRTGEVTYHADGPTEDWAVTLVDTGPPEVEKGARIYRVARYIEADTFFVTYGDGVGDVDVDALLTFHRQHGRLATITGVHPRSQYGVLQVDDEGRILGFEQKPLLEHWVNAGFMVFEREVLEYLAGDERVHLERDVFPRLAAEGQLMMYRHIGFWRSMDTFKEAMELDALWRKRAPWKVW